MSEFSRGKGKMPITVSEVTLNFVFGSVTFKIDELNQTLTSILDEMRLITSELRSDERQLLRKIMSSASGTFTVSELYLNFQKGSEPHETLRRLRDAQFIRPLGGGRWEADKQIEIKAFGKLMWEKVREDKLFSNYSSDRPSPNCDRT
jgi:hypothetical protein